MTIEWYSLIGLTLSLLGLVGLLIFIVATRHYRRTPTQLTARLHLSKAIDAYGYQRYWSGVRHADPTSWNETTPMQIVMYEREARRELEAAVNEVVVAEVLAALEQATPAEGDS